LTCRDRWRLLGLVLLEQLTDLLEESLGLASKLQLLIRHFDIIDLDLARAAKETTSQATGQSSNSAGKSTSDTAKTTGETAQASAARGTAENTAEKAIQERTDDGKVGDEVELPAVDLDIATDDGVGDLGLELLGKTDHDIRSLLEQLSLLSVEGLHADEAQSVAQAERVEEVANDVKVDLAAQNRDLGKGGVRGKCGSGRVGRGRGEVDTLEDDGDGLLDGLDGRKVRFGQVVSEEAQGLDAGEDLCQKSRQKRSGDITNLAGDGLTCVYV
jgi:hypothetical protein